MTKEPLEIIGGGLAGLSLALGLARRHVPVRLHEAHSYPRHRVCGEFILGLTEPEMETLGLAEALADAECHETAVWFQGSTRLAELRLPYPARGISRHRLDERLVRLARASGAEIIEHSRISTPDPACGRIWAAGPRKTATSPWIGLKAHFHNLPLAAGLEMHLGNGGYVGLTSIENGRTNLCGLFPGPLAPAESRAAQISTQLRHIGLAALAERLDSATCDPKSTVGVTHFSLGWSAPEKTSQPVARIGDHLAIIPPFTGAGMSMAFAAAAMALPILESGEPWPEICHRLQLAQQKAFGRCLRWSSWLHPWLLQPKKQALMVAALRAKILPFQWLTRKLRATPLGTPSPSSARTFSKPP